MRQKHKKIAVLMSGSACANGKAAEAMRMSVGLTLRNPGVRLFLLDGGAKVLDVREPYPEQQALFMEHLNAYLDLGCPLMLEEINGGRPRHFLEGSGMEARSRKEILRDMTDSDLVILLDGAQPRQEPSEEIPEPLPTGDDSVGILHLVRKAPGILFYQALRAQRSARRLTIVLMPGVELRGGLVPGQILQLVTRKRQRAGSALPLRINYSELLDLIFHHERVFCW